MITCIHTWILVENLLFGYKLFVLDKVCVCVCVLAHTRKVMTEFGGVYRQQYAVALFNSVRFEIEGGGNAQTQLLHRKVTS